MPRNNMILEPDWGIDFGKMPQFEIRYLEKRRETLYVDGMAHSAIQIGDVFKLLMPLGSETGVNAAVTTLELKVESITAYHTSLNRINAEMRAGLIMSGACDTLFQALRAAGWSGEDSQRLQRQPEHDDVMPLVLTR